MPSAPTNGVPVFPEVVEQLDKLAAELKIKPLRERSSANSSTSFRGAAEAAIPAKPGASSELRLIRTAAFESVRVDARRRASRGADSALAVYFGAIASRTRATVSAGVL